MLKRLSIAILASILLILSFPVANIVNAGNLTAMSDTMSRLKASTAANHLISFTMTAGTTAIESETITVTFPAAFDTSTIDCGDIDLLDDGVEENLQNEAGGCTADADEWGAVFAADVLTLTAPSGAATYLAASSIVVIEIGTNTAEEGVGNEQIVNSGSGSQTISIGGTFGDTGSFAVPIMTEDQVTVSATVDPTITSALSATTCSLGTLSASAINTCRYTNTVSTNATGGYTSTIVDLSTTTAGKLCSPSLVVCTTDINRATGSVDLGSEEYAVGTSKAGQTIAQFGTVNADCDTPANPLVSTAISNTQTPQQYANAAGPVSSDATILCHAASITATTPAGSYSEIVTHITTGTF